MKFDFGSGRTFHMRVTCHLVSVSHKMAKMLSGLLSLLIGSSSNLLITWTDINLGQDFSAVWTIGMIVNRP